MLDQAAKQNAGAWAATTGVDTAPTTDQTPPPIPDTWNELEQQGYRFQVKGTAIGQRWTRAMQSDTEENKAIRNKYERSDTLLAKEKIRAEWARGKHAEVMGSHTHQQSFSTEQQSQGTWSTLAAMAARQGGVDVALGLRKAVNVARDCGC